MPKVSIIIPCYNQGQFVRQAVRSALEQSVSELIEVIIINDGSTDDSSDVLNSFTEPSVRIIQQGNAGPAAARNVGIRASAGEYINFLDADDYLSHRKVERQLQILDDNSEIDMVFCDVQIVDEAGNPSSDYTVKGAFRPFSSSFMESLLSGGFMPPHTALIRRQVLETTGLFDESTVLRGSEDYEFWLRLAATGAKVSYVDSRDAFYRRHTSNASLDRRQMNESRREALKRIARRFPAEVGCSLGALQDTNRELFESVEYHQRIAAKASVEASESAKRHEMHVSNLRSAEDRLSQLNGWSVRQDDHIRTLAQQNVVLNQTLNVALSEGAKLYQEVNTLQRESQSAICRVTEQFTESQIRHMHRETDLGTAINLQASEIRIIRADLSTAEAARRDLASRLEDTQTQLAATVASKNSFELRSVELSGWASAQDEHIKSLIRNENELRAAVNVQDAEIKALREHLLLAENAKNDVESHLDNARMQLAEQKAAMESATAELRNWNEAQDGHIRILIQNEINLRAAVSLQENETKIVRTELEAISLLKTDLQNRLSDLQTQLAVASNQRAVLESANVELRGWNEAQDGHIRVLTQKEIDLRAALSLQESEIKTVRSDLTAIQHLKRQLENRLDDLETRLSVILHEKTALESRNAELSNWATAQDSHIKTLIRNEKELRVRYDVVVSDLATANRDKALGTERITELAQWSTAQAAHIKTLIENERSLQMQLEAAHRNMTLPAVIRRSTRYLVHRGLDTLQSSTPERVRAIVRPTYLRFYRRLYPAGKVEFCSPSVARVQLGTASIDSPVLVSQGGTTAKDAPRESEGSLSPTVAICAIYPTYRPKVTVVMPVWNHSQFLAAAVTSVLKQTHANLELIVVDDGSDEDVLSALMPFIEDSRLIVVQKEHSGISRTLTVGFRRATGDFWTWTSADNVLHPECLNTLLEALLRNPALDMAYSDMDLIDDEGMPLMESGYRKAAQDPTSSNRLHLSRAVETLGLISDNFIGASFLYRAEIGRIMGAYDPALIGTEDYDYWLRINALGTIAHINSADSLYSYRVHAKTLSASRPEIPANAIALIEYHRQRLAYYRRPFIIFIVQHPERIAHRWVQVLVQCFVEKGQQVEICSKDNYLIRMQACAPTEKQVLMSFDQSTCISGLGENDLPVIQLTYRDNPLRASRISDHRSWFLFTSTSGIPREVAHSGRWSLFVPPDQCWEDEFELNRKARDNRYEPWDLPNTNTTPTAVYCGPVRDNVIDLSTFAQLLKACPEWQFVFISTEPGMEFPVGPWAAEKNFIYLGYKPIESQYQYLSVASILVAPFCEGASEAVMQDVMLAYAYTAKPVVSSGEVRRAALDSMPNIHVCSTKEFAGAIALRALTRTDGQAADEYIKCRSAKTLACRLLGIANNLSFYSSTRRQCLGVDDSENITRNLLDKRARSNSLHKSGRRLSVLIVTPSLDRGGLERVVADVAYDLRAIGFQITIAVAGRNGLIGAECQGRGIEVELVGNDGEGISELLTRNGVDVVLSHYSTAGIRVAGLSGIPVISVIHNAYVWHTEADDHKLLEVDSWISRYIAVSSFAGRYFQHRYAIDPKRIQCIPNGINLERYTTSAGVEPVITRRTLGIPEDAYVFLEVASFNAVKGQLHAVCALKEVAEKLGDVRLVFVGLAVDRTYHDLVVKTIREAQLNDKIIVAGDTDRVEDYYCLADAFILPSITEGWSLAMTEAMFYGLPLLLTRVGGAADVCGEEDLGIVIPPPYPDVSKITHQELWDVCTDKSPPNLTSLSDAMIRMYRERKMWKTRGLQGRQRVVAHHDSRTVADAYSKVISDCWATMGGSRSNIAPQAH